MASRATIARSVQTRGIGLHTGQTVTLTLRPAPPGTGVVFVRLDCQGKKIPADQKNLSSSAYASTLSRDAVKVSTVEHLQSALLGMGVDDLWVELDGAEVPILDGSAAPFLKLLARAGRRESGVDRQVMRVNKPLTVEKDGKSITVEPGRGLEIRYSIDFSHPVIGDSSKVFTLRARTYARDIAPARTFCRLQDVEILRQAGLARGGSLANALVVDDRRVLNGPLRFRDEFVRHKILDLLGDLALLGMPLEGRITAVRAGHALHGEFLRALVSRTDVWSLVTHAPVRHPRRRTVLAVPA
ncbi:MAG: UDP-3-O-acyl-N-acetylglucosamine deacetylase [Acidobacteriota bacterium]